MNDPILHLALGILVVGALWFLIVWCAFGVWTYFERQRAFDRRWRRW